MSAFEELQGIIAEKLSKKPEEIKPESSFIDDLGADSLDLADLVMLIEDKYHVDFSSEDQDKFRTVADVVAAIEKHT